jgi:hypothetical protein
VSWLFWLLGFDTRATHATNLAGRLSDERLRDRLRDKPHHLAHAAFPMSASASGSVMLLQTPVPVLARVSPGIENPFLPERVSGPNRPPLLSL